MSVPLNLSRIHYPIRSLGPGARIGIWFQGCSIRCNGCISADTWAVGRGGTSVEAVIQAIETWLTAADGVTISGGEPFDQPAALSALLSAIKGRTPADILVYSGYSFDQLQATLSKLGGLVDALISGPFVRDAPQTFPLRGSDNQQLHCLTRLGARRFLRFQESDQRHDRSLDLMFDDDGTAWIAGIPQRGDLEQLVELLAADGHRANTSQAPTGRTGRRP